MELRHEEASLRTTANKTSKILNTSNKMRILRILRTCPSGLTYAMTHPLKDTQENTE